MAEQNVLPSFFDSLVPDYSGYDRDKADAQNRVGPETPDPTELFTAIGNWADFCTAPRGTVIRHPDEPIDNFPYGTEPPDPHDDSVTIDPEEWRRTADNRPYNLPMPGLRIESFFDAAHMLTGNDLNGIGAVWDVLRIDHNEFLKGTMVNPEHPELNLGTNEFFTIIDTILTDWSGEAATAAERYSAQLKDAYESQARMTGWLADSLMAYTGIVVGARKQMLDLMRAFRETMRNKERTSAQDDRAFVIGVLTTVLSAMVSAAAAFMSGGTTLGITLGSQFLTTGIGLANQVMTAPKGTVAGDDYADIAVSYLQQAGEIVQDASNAIYGLINDLSDRNPMKYLTLDSSWAQVPKPLVTSKQFDSDPGTLDHLGEH